MAILQMTLLAMNQFHQSAIYERARVGACRREGGMMRLSAFIDCVNKGMVPPCPPSGLDEHGWGHPADAGFSIWRAGWEARTHCTERGMWAIVSLDWTEQLADWIDGRLVLEIMAGAGWLARALDHHGVRVIATDNASWDARHDKMKRVYPVAKMEASEAITAHPEAEVLVVSWPPYGDHAICEACNLWGSERPIVYIGEDDGGCNAPERFFARFCKDEKAPHIPLMSWNGLHDHVMIGCYLDKDMWVVREDE